MRKPFQVMKFGGTSLADPSCIQRAVEIVRTASRECSIVVVVSAMNGVTNRLIETANQSLGGNDRTVAETFAQLGKQHNEVITALAGSVAQAKLLQSKVHDLLIEGECLCRGALLSGELTARTLDAISGLGERLCAPLVAAALSDAGVASEALDATELVITDFVHGGAEPRIDQTRARCQSRLAPLLEMGIVPVVTGFIGSTEKGVVTTLGRGGSDYSATILAEALDADEVVIWSDVTGLLTADPKLVAEACTIQEISYREAAELARFGAKVLHPKTLHPVVRRGIPVWIKNTFAAGDPGTKITPKGPSNAPGVTAITAIRNAVLITIAGPGTTHDALARTVATAAAIGVDVLLISQSSSRNAIHLVIPSPAAQSTVDALRREFLLDPIDENAGNIVFYAAASLITLVGHNLRIVPGTAARVIDALKEENIMVAATTQGSCDSSMSFVLPQPEMELALATLHRELELGRLPAKKRSLRAPASQLKIWKHEPGRASAD
jgi:bifunctional aspartokinase / homoserine dehydrogenase 1